MTKENFKNLLTDLYNIYNPANLQYIDELVERYNRMEFDAVKNIFLKYNRKSASYYNPELDNDSYIINLIKEYEAGSRELETASTKNEPVQKPEVVEKQAVMQGFQEIQDAQKEIRKEVTEEVNKKIQGIEESFNEKELAFKKQLETIYQDFARKLSTLKESNDDVTIRIFSTYSNSELDLPNKKIIAGLGKGSRLIIKDKDGKTIGLEISDITYDGISDIDGKPLIEIFVDKV